MEIISDHFGVIALVLVFRQSFENCSNWLNKTKTNPTLYERFSSRLELQLISRYSDWFIVLFAPVRIGRTLVLVLLTVT